MHDPLNLMREAEEIPLAVQLFSAKELTQREAKAKGEFAKVQQLIGVLVRLDRERTRTWDDLRRHMGWRKDDESGAPNRPKAPLQFETAEAYINHQVEVQAFDEMASRLLKRHSQATRDTTQTRKDLRACLQEGVWYRADNHGVMLVKGRVILSPWRDLPTADHLSSIDY